MNPTPAVQGLSAHRRNRPGREQPRPKWPRPYTHGVAKDRNESTEFRDKDERVSLAPLDPEEALRALLAVKPGERAAEATGNDDASDTAPGGPKV